MSTFTWQPLTGAKVAYAPKVRTAVFGDGYEQRVKDGLNANPRTWNLTFKDGVTNINAILAFLKARGGAESFTWVPPDAVEGKFICSQWDMEYQTGVSTLSATFKEVFEP